MHNGIKRFEIVNKRESSLLLTREERENCSVDTYLRFNSSIEQIYMHTIYVTIPFKFVNNEVDV